MKYRYFKFFVAVVCIFATTVYSGKALSLVHMPLLSPGIAEAAIISLDRAISTLAAVGGAGAVVAFVAGTTGLAGGAALVMAFSTIGGPLGMLGGVAGVALIAVIVHAISEHGMGYVMERFAQKWEQDGKNLYEIEQEIDAISGWLVSDELKTKTKNEIRKYME